MGDGILGVRAERQPTDGDGERGSVLAIVLLLTMTVGAMVTAHLAKVAAEHRNVRTRLYADRALARAMGELERAKNVVNASPYSGEVNEALIAAVESDPPFVPGTRVEARRVGTMGGDWFVLRAVGSYGSIEKTAQVFVRQRSPVSAYNFFVVDHPLGISGAPRGAIHSNKTVDFYFPGGFYRDQVTASEGFEFRAGATRENTTLLGQWDARAPTRDLLEEVEVADLRDEADTLRITDDLIAEIEFQGEQARVELYSPSRTIQVEKRGVRQVFSHYENRTYRVREKRYRKEYYTVDVPVYERRRVWTTTRRKVYEYRDVVKTERVPVYDYRTERYNVRVPVYGKRRVRKADRQRVWVEDPPPRRKDIEGGFSVGGSARELGHWEWHTRWKWVEETYVEGYRNETRTRTKRVLVRWDRRRTTERKRVFSHYEKRRVQRRIRVKVGTRKETRSRWKFSHYEYRNRTRRVPVYRQEPYTYYEKQTVPERLVRTETVPTRGIIYVENEIRAIEGRINGQVSVASNTGVRITGPLVYVDDGGRTRMLNGGDPSRDYEFNPEYAGDSVLGIMSDGDITYGREAPDELEINASLISVNGKVASEGISVSDDGKTVSMQVAEGEDPASYVKESIRRLGGIVSRLRPVTTFVDRANRVLAGFRKGISYMDRNMILKTGGNVSPPYVFQADRPTWVMGLAGRRIDVGGGR